MSDGSSSIEPASASETLWPLRTVVLSVLGALAALVIQQFSDLEALGLGWQQRLAEAFPLLVGVGAVAFGLVWRRHRLLPAIIISLICGLVCCGVFLWSASPGGERQGVIWQFLCGLTASAALLALFEAAQEASVERGVAGRPAGFSLGAIRAWSREAIDYADVHGAMWTNALLIAASGLFTLLSLALAYLLSSMFMLVKLEFLRDALRIEAVMALLCGAAFGAALGLLRDRGTIIAALQRVAMLVLRILAPVFALGVGVFLAALPVTGLAPLWQTGGTTPIMLTGAMLALFLVNAVVADQPADESRSVLLSASAAALGIFLLPMVGIAIYSSALRIHQYGLSPERLWALAFLVVASITAIGYAVSIVGAGGWFARLRRTNRTLVFLIAGIALLLSLPIVGFERIATAHQLARLAGGQVSPEKFDYRGLWFDFGPPGREAIQQLATRSTDPTIRKIAGETAKLKDRWAETPAVAAQRVGESLDERLTILPATLPLEAGLRKRIVSYDACGADSECLVYHVPGDDFAIVASIPGPDCTGCAPTPRLLRRERAVWLEASESLGEGDIGRKLVKQLRAGQVEVRPVTRRQIFIGGVEVGNAMPAEPDRPEAP